MNKELVKIPPKHENLNTVIFALMSSFNIGNMSTRMNQ